MPTYEYECDVCNHRFEVEQNMRDDPLTECPRCSGPVRRVFSPNSVIFKGSGFYCTDSKQSAKPHEEPACAAKPAGAPSSS